MQITSRYLYKNRIKVVADVAGFITEYKPVYQRTIQVYKGIDNVLQFRLYNSDQKPVDISSYTPKFVAFDENKNLIIEHDGTQVTSDGSTPITGLCEVTITENDLLNVKQQYLSYNIYLVDTNDSKVLTYTDSHFGNDGVIKISAEAFPGPIESVEVTNFLQTDVNEDEWVSSTIDAQPGINGNEALHTAAIYTDAYEGTLTVQATLDNQASETTKWADIASHTFVGNETTPIPVNFNGIFNHLRFKVDANPADKITKILVRN